MRLQTLDTVARLRIIMQSNSSIQQPLKWGPYDCGLSSAPVWLPLPSMQCLHHPIPIPLSVVRFQVADLKKGNSFAGSNMLLLQFSRCRSSSTFWVITCARWKKGLEAILHWPLGPSIPNQSNPIIINCRKRLLQLHANALSLKSTENNCASFFLLS